MTDLELMYNNMTPRQRQAVKLYQTGKYTQKQIGEVMGIGQSEVSYLIKYGKTRAKRRLRIS